jgi:hemoglobin
MAARRIVFTACCVLLGSAVFAQSSPGPLYERLGGKAVVTAFVGETIDRAAVDPGTRRTFDKVNLQHVKDMLIEQICSLTGGGCLPRGGGMRDVYAGHPVSDAEFLGLVETLREAMRGHDVPIGARNELLEILAPL